MNSIEMGNTDLRQRHLFQLNLNLKIGFQACCRLMRARQPHITTITISGGFAKVLISVMSFLFKESRAFTALAKAGRACDSCVRAPHSKRHFTVESVKCYRFIRIRSSRFKSRISERESCPFTSSKSFCASSLIALASFVARLTCY